MTDVLHEDHSDEQSSGEQECHTIMPAASFTICARFGIHRSIFSMPKLHS
jgi:hypothetical protein